MRVRELMRKNPRTVLIDTPIEVVWDLVSQEKLYMVPVLDNDGYIKGIVTAEDLLTRLVPDYREFFSNFYPEAPTIEDIEGKLERQISLVAADVMNSTVYTVYDHHDVFKALSRMIAYNVRVLPVTDKKEVLIGFIVQKDIFSYLFERHKHILEKIRRKEKKMREGIKEKGKEKARRVAALADAFKIKSSKYFTLIGSKKKKKK